MNHRIGENQTYQYGNVASLGRRGVRVKGCLPRLVELLLLMEDPWITSLSSMTELRRNGTQTQNARIHYFSCMFGRNHHKH